MSYYFIKTPSFIQKMYPNLTWSFSSSKKEIYLTFDDGPTPEITEWVLETLQKFNAKATFFCIGKNVENHPDIFKKIINDGHSIGNHTNNHLNGWKTNIKKYLSNVSIAEKAIQQFNNSTSLQLFRPPYGKIKRKQARLLIKKGCEIIMWNVLSADFDKSINPEKCLDNVLQNTKNGSIVIFHDSAKAEKNMKYALPKMLAHFKEKGYEFKAIT